MGLLTKMLLAEAFLPARPNQPVEVSDPQLKGMSVLMGLIHQLDAKPRRGWVMRDVKDPETVGEHCEEAARMIRLLAPLNDPPVDPHTASIMMLTHDLVEAPPQAGDITPHDAVSPAEKKRRENAAMDYIHALPTPRGLTSRIARAWHEFEANETPTARLANETDKLQLARMACLYENTQGKNMPDMWAYADHGIHAPMPRLVFNQLKAQRPAAVGQRPLTVPHALTPEMEQAANARAAERQREKFLARMQRLAAD